MHKIPSSISLEKYLTRANQNMTDDLMNHPHMIWHQSPLIRPLLTTGLNLKIHCLKTVKL